MVILKKSIRPVTMKHSDQWTSYNNISTIEHVDKDITAKLQKKQKRTHNTSSSGYAVNKLKLEA